jgi:fido (protein-threonine AMPylation protein)
MSMMMPGRGRPARVAIFAAVDQEVEELRRIGGLPSPDENRDIWRDIWYAETHQSTAIEGNTLLLKQVRTLLDEGRAVGGEELAQYLEVQGYAEAAQWVYEQATGTSSSAPEDRLSLTELRQIHRTLVEAVWKVKPPDQFLPGEGPGAFRLHDVQPFLGGMRPVPFTEIHSRLTDWLELANGPPPGGQHLMEHLATVHAVFEQIHPFRDGNGRAGRLALNLLLVRRGYAPAVIYKRDRQRYLSALRRADRGDSGALAELLARAVKYGLDRFLLPGLAGPHRLLPLPALITGDLSLLALRRAAAAGRLEATQREGRWYSTKRNVAAYGRSRRRGRPAGPR